MKYMVAELMFTAKKAWHENGMICILLSDNREVRFPRLFKRETKKCQIRTDCKY